MIAQLLAWRNHRYYYRSRLTALWARGHNLEPQDKLTLEKKNDRAIIALMTKGEDTKRTILAVGLDVASRIGLEQVSIGGLAKEAGLSKSGLYAHFQSKEALQIDILHHAGQMFAGSVLIPALQVRAGVPRIKALVENWDRWNRELAGGCIFVSASNAFKNIPGKVRDFLVAQQHEWLGSLKRLGQSAIDCGDFRKDADIEQFAYELYTLLLGYHLFYKMIQSDNPKQSQLRALERLIDAFR